MNEIQIFNNSEFGEIRTLETADGNILFCGADVANALGYSNAPDAIAKHCKKDGIAKCDTLTNGGLQKLTYINEGNVYRLIARSKLPSAERFETWVFDEVLPTIRKKGSYTVPQMSQTEIIAAMANNAVALEKRITEQEKAVADTNQRIDNMKDIMQPVSDDWRPAMNKLVNRISQVANYPIDELRVDIYDEVDIRGGVHLETRLENLRNRMWERGTAWSSVTRINKLDVIEQDKKLIAIYVAVVREFAAKYI